MSGGRSVESFAADLLAGRRSAVELTKASLAAAKRTQASLRSFITIAAEEALAQATESDLRRKVGGQLGPLDGMPYAAKDIFQTRGIRTTAGSRVLEDWIPDRSAVAIERLADAGAVLIGKTNLHEFAYGATGENAWSGTVANPHDETRLAGGSSGGSAAAVAVGVVPFALGTDTGGSARVPAALCGIAGYKPSMGRISLEGAIPYCWSLDHAGILGSTAGDLIAVAECLGAVGVGVVVAALPARPLRVGLVRGWAERSAPAVRQGFKTARDALAGMGAVLCDVDLPDLEEARTVSLTIQLAETLTYHGPNLRRPGAAFGDDIRAGLVLGQFLSAESYIQCKRLVARYLEAFRALFDDDVDILLTPACPVVAPPIGAVHVEVGGEKMPVGNALTLFTSFFNLVGAPAVVLRAGADPAGLPVGVQLVGDVGADALVLAAAHALEGQGLGMLAARHP
ncbi:amidase [Chelativorans xinjiangense]|uniref:amidase n=1 Tax=Chelativorans xinjiangense TaxID=2681485 RepID=UPI00135B7BB0|nr:amidase [Chelativorans xinjiangense]